MEIEDTITIATPEGVELRVVLAGAGSRFIAGLFDVTVQVILIIASLVFCNVVIGGGLGQALGYIAIFLIVFLYYIPFELFDSGHSPGKRLAHLQVLRQGGDPVDLPASAIRTVVRPIDALPGLYLVGLVLIMATRRNQRLGDIAAGTIVIREARGGGALRAVPTPAVASPAVALPATAVPAPAAPAAAAPSATGPATGVPGRASVVAATPGTATPGTATPGAAMPGPAVPATPGPYARQAAAESGAAPPPGMAGAPSAAGPPPSSASWDVSAVTAEELAAVQRFLVRRETLDPSSRSALARRLEQGLRAKVSGGWYVGDPEQFLEALARIKSER